MNQQEALSVLIDGVKKAYVKQAYSFEEAGLLFSAMQTFAPAPAPKSKPETNPAQTQAQKRQQPPTTSVPGEKQ